MMKKWIFPPENKAQVEQLASALRISPVTARMLINRGLTEPIGAQSFLQPSLHRLCDPCEDPTVNAAAAFLLDAIHAGRHITVFGDYDADGICGAALLVHALRFLDARVDFYIPHRVDEGYGLSRDALRELADGGSEVIVTVDCGVTALEEAAYARKLGMDLIITDHHPPREEHPDATFVIDPKLADASFGYENLAGVGVAFKLVWAIGQRISENSRVSQAYRDLLMEALALVAIGTIADVVPMVDENRVLAHYGLKTLNVSSLPGLRALIASSRPRSKRISARDVAFVLAPRLNAAGRMGHARQAVEMLVTSDERQATELATELERHNRRRIKTQSDALKQAEEELTRSGQLDRDGCIVLASPEWHLGVVGLVASRLSERHWRPAFIFNIQDGVAKGSARGINGFPVHACVQQCADLLDRYGGHSAAAGMTLPEKNLPAFAERLNQLAEEFLGGKTPVPDLSLDGEVSLEALSTDMLHEINLLAPFGSGNAPPVFAANDLHLVGNPQIVGSGRSHLAMRVRQGRAVLRAICLGKADWLEDLRARKGQPFSLAFQPGLDHYQGRTSVELRAEDIQWDGDRLVERRDRAAG